MSVVSYIKIPREAAIEKVISDKIISHELAELILGDYLGEGASRFVFQSAMNKKHVIKIDSSDWNANVTEYEVWKKVWEIPALSKWFAPVVSISRYGRILVMEKAKTAVDTKKFPKRIPSFFTDVKDANFGFIGKQFVCIDYSEHNLWESGMKVKMRDVKW